MSKKTVEELKMEAYEFIEEYKQQKNRSKLDEYKEIIEMLRREGLSFAKVAEFLNKRAGLKVSSSTVRMYVKEHLEKDDADGDDQKDEQTQTLHQ